MSTPTTDADLISRIAELEAWRLRLISKFPGFRVPVVVADALRESFEPISEPAQETTDADLLARIEKAAANACSRHAEYVRNSTAAYNELCTKYRSRGLEIEALQAELDAEKANKTPTDQKLDEILARLAPASTLSLSG